MRRRPCSAMRGSTQTPSCLPSQAYSRAPVNRSDERSSKVMKVITKTSWDQKMKEKQQRQALREQKLAVIQASKDKRKVGAHGAYREGLPNLFPASPP